MFRGGKNTERKWVSTIFISHSSADNALATELFDWLKSQRYHSIFLDLDPDEGIEAGERWENVLYRELMSCSVVLALITENWSASKWCFAEATHARSSGKTILGLTVSRDIQPAILTDTQSIDYSPDNRAEAYLRLAVALRRAIDPQGLGRWDPSRPLFPGLLFFDERDAPIFFGRRHLGRAIYQKLRELQAKPPGSERLLLVFGPSGSGKSSVVRAGTLSHIHANPEAWITLGPFRPSEGWPEPLRQNLAVLAGPDEVASSAKIRRIADQLRREANAPKGTILLVIDQFEEALDAKDDTRSFWLPLSRLLTPDDTPFMALATLRSDFMGDFQNRSAQNALRFASFPIEPMSPEDFREVITGPCRVAGIPIEPGLVDALAGDAGGEQALPLLALALNRLWLRYESKQGGFTVTDYQDGLGGLRGLIDREAEITLAGKGLREASVLNAFLSLTRLVREGILARQPAAWDRLEPEAQKSLEPFIEARLLVLYSAEHEKFGVLDTKNAVVVDLVHETLLTGWKRLHDWLEKPENRDFLSWRDELRHKVIRWTKIEESKRFLLEGPELKDAKKWLNVKRLALDAQEAAYIQAGIEANKTSKIKFAVVGAVLLALGCGWWGWTRTGIYQIRAIENAFPEIMRSIADSSGKIPADVDPLIELAGLGRSDLAMLTTEKIYDARTRTFAFQRIAEMLAKVAQNQQAAQTFERALAEAEKIQEKSWKANAIADIIKAMAKAGQTQQALAVADRIDDDRTKAEALQDIAEALAAAGQTQQALAVADRIDDDHTKAYVLQVIADMLTKADRSQQAAQVLFQVRAAADKIKDPYQKDKRLREIVAALTKVGQTQEALATAEKIDDAETKAEALEEMAETLTETGLFHEALAAAERIGEPVLAAETLIKIADALITVGQNQQAVQILNQSLAASDKIISDEMRKVYALADITEALAAAGQIQQALATADKIDYKFYVGDKVDVLEDIFAVLKTADHIKQALAAVDRINDDRTKAEALRALAQALAAAGQTQQALALADRIDDDRTKAEALRGIAEALAAAGETQQALAIVDKVGTAEIKAKALQVIAGALTQTGQNEQAVQILIQTLAIADTIDEAKTKAYILEDIVEALTVAGPSEQVTQALLQAFTAANSIAEDHNKTAERKKTILQNIVKALTSAHQIQQALAAADSINDAQTRNFALIDIAAALVKADQIQNAISVADKIREDTKWKDIILERIADTLAEAGRIQEALPIVDRIDDMERKGNTLGSMAPALANLGMIDRANLILENAIKNTNRIRNEITVSNSYGNIAVIYARLAQYYAARMTAEKASLARDTLKGYMAILKYYTIEEHPELEKKPAELQRNFVGPRQWERRSSH